MQIVQLLLLGVTVAGVLSQPLQPVNDGTDVNFVEHVNFGFLTPVAEGAKEGSQSFEKNMKEGIVGAAELQTIVTEGPSAKDHVTNPRRSQRLVANNFENVVTQGRLANVFRRIYRSLMRFFHKFRCDVDGDTFAEMAKELFQVDSEFLSALKWPTSGFLQFLQKLPGPACTFLWHKAEQKGKMLKVLRKFLEKVASKCPLINKGNPAISLEIGASGGVAKGFGNVEISAGIGLGLDLSGNRYCYIGGCASRGVKFPPVPAAFNRDVGWSINVWESPSAIAGTSGGFSLDVGGSGKKIGATYYYEGSDSTKLNPFSHKTLGVGFSGEWSGGSVTPNAAVAALVCKCPLCVNTQGHSC